jgi:hypothetical protein
MSYKLADLSSLIFSLKSNYFVLLQALTKIIYSNIELKTQEIYVFI